MALAGVILFGVLLAVSARPRGHILTGDTPGVARGARVALDCVYEGRWTGCGALPGQATSEVRAYPLLQYLPAVVMVELGGSNLDVLRGLATASLISFAVTLALVVVAGRRLDSPAATPLLLVVVLTGPTVFYATSAFGEMLAATLVLATMVAILERRPGLILAAALAAGLAKETLPLFVVLLGLVVGREPGSARWWPERRVLAPLVGGSVLALAASAGFNQFRFGTLTNATYLRPDYDIGAARSLRNVGNLLVAPNGGLVWFWTSACLLLVAVAAVAVVATVHRRWSAAVPPLAVLGIFALFMAGLGSWWSPFGWVAFGPRLVVPLVPALAVAALHAGGPRLTAVIGAGLARAGVAAAVLLVVLASAWPQAGAPWQGERLPRLIPVYDPVCARGAPPRSEPFFDCLDQIAWWRRPNQLVEASWGGGAGAVAGRVVVLVTTTLLVLEVRRRTRPRAPAPVPGAVATAR